MPKATKDTKKDEEKKISKVDKVAKSKTNNSKKASTSKIATNTKKTTESKKTTKTKKPTTTSSKTVKSTSKVAKKSTSTTTKKKSTTSNKAKKLDTGIIAEYYDLPYRYNETIVKILYQTPHILFVYWDISDADRNTFVQKYGDDFFYNTKPILKIYNLTKNYNFEVEIDDFANSWYINVNDANSDYKVELARKPINHNEKFESDYIYISSSNDIEFPNDHILLEELPSKINFKNVKTNKITTKDIGSLRLIGINKIYSIYNFYKKLYKDEILEELNNNQIKLSSSSTSSWS